MGKKSRIKGKGYELEVAKDLALIFPHASRLLEYQEGFGYDLQNTGNFNIQCRRYKKYVPISHLKDVPRTNDRIPVLATRGDNEKSVVCLYLEDFIRILEDIGIAY
ncbi:MAG TPA: hypothetical protein VLB82_05420 [Thermodesulfobacteriota bacterium]|nr:hypothetical protein [Thermodesulfobacteriota bacterium]